MSTDSWSCPEANEDGFVLFSHVRRRAKATTREQFVREFPVPALITMIGSDPESPDTLDPADSGVQLLTVNIKSAAILRYLGKVAFVAKRPGNPFAHLISVGRSASNDITLAVDSVSKVHGYFVQEGPGWRFTDHGSTNGSTVNGSAVASGEKAPLFDGSVLKLGVEATLEFVTPESLYQRALES